MQDNIFLKNKPKDKFNPDVHSLIAKKNSERKKSDFQESKTIYNAITNNVPEKIRNAKDLQIKVEQPTENLKRLMASKLSERNKQQVDLKPQKLKALPKDIIIDKPSENFEELKKNSELFIKKEEDYKNLQKIKKQEIIKSLKKTALLGELKDLGLLK
jgi:hypothetical protein